MKERTLLRLKKRAARAAAGKRNPTDYPMPQPTGPLSANVVPVDFNSWRAARAGVGHPGLLKAFKIFGSYGIKPKRSSAGLIWNKQAFWWTLKGFYRPGADRKTRKPLQHYVWEHHHQRVIPPMHEIFFRDRNRNNFDPANLEMLSKGELHRRCVDLGEVPQLGFEERSQNRSKWACKVSKSRTALLLNNFNQKDKHEINHTIIALRARRFGTDPR